jgi:hypothetical protein
MTSRPDLIVQVLGIISVSAKLLPTIQNLVNKVAAERGKQITLFHQNKKADHTHLRSLRLQNP